jgi:hypothetical protein
MATTHLYFSLIPESFVASMLDPHAYGAYLATGTSLRARGPAIFFEIDPDLKCEHFPMHLVGERCVPHPDGSPRHSVYLSIYRVLEHMPIDAIGNLYLATADGRVLELTPGEYAPSTSRKGHLYQEFCPVNPCVASRLDAPDFCRFITSSESPVSVPRIVFSELRLQELANDPVAGSAENLPYLNIEHVRHCLAGLLDRPEKKVKMVQRRMRGPVLYRTIRNGFFLGGGDDLKYYPMPSVEELDSKHHEWWRSAQETSLD